jgi:hypothetical protein
VQLGHARADGEHRRLIGVAWDAGRRLGLLHHVDVRVGPDEKLPLVAHPGPAQAGLAVGQREHHVAEQLGAGSECLVGRIRQQAADEEQVARDPPTHEAGASPTISPVTSRATSAA